MNARQEIDGVLHKQCSDCFLFKPLDAFYSKQGRCKDCHKANNKAWREANPERFAEMNRSHQRRNKYGISNQHFRVLLLVQEGRCAICGRTPEEASPGRPQLVVDHNHDTGKVRGLLCHPCNAGMGLLQDDIDTLEKALAYLKGDVT
jgi:hypothetical protein